MSVSRETPTADEVARHFDVSRETLLRLRGFATLLLRWNRTINLISRADENQLWARHIADALQLAPLIPVGVERAIDLGSGAGFPGLVLSIVHGAHVDLVESDQRKAAFLREAAREARAPVTVHACRIEVASLPRAPLVTARALAPLRPLLDLAAPFLAEGGSFLFPKGREAEVELTEAAAAWNMRVDRFPSKIDRGGLILRISEVARV